MPRPRLAPRSAAARRRRRRALAVAALAAVLTASCGTSDGDDGEGAAEAPSSTVATEGRPGTGPAGTDGAGEGGTDRAVAVGRAACPTADDVEDPRSSQRAETAVGVDDDEVDGVGDPTLPDLGDPRLDVVATDLDLLVEDGALAEAAATLTVETTEATDEVAFDLVGLDVTAVVVDGEAVEAERQGAKLVVPLGAPLDTGDRAEVLVCYRGAPTPIESDAVYGATVGWVGADEGTFVLAEPEAGRTWFPANEHPTDKSTFTFTVTVDEDLVALANGVLMSGPVPCTGVLVVEGDVPAAADALDGGDEACQGEDDLDGPDDGDRGDGVVTWRWVMDDPMAAYLATVVIGEYERQIHPTAGDVPVETWYPADDGRAPRGFAAASDIVAFLSEVAGPFPFASLGNTVLPGRPDDPFLDGVAFEAQAMSIYAPDTAVEPIVVHETAHQWFGDAVSVERWAQDLWWVEGFATYAEWLWLEEQEGSAAYDAAVASAERAIDGDPGTIGDLEPDALFGSLAYEGGALVFHALRDEVGDEVFSEILRTFVDRYRYANASTDDLIAVASEVSGEDLDELFASWLDTPDRPPAPR